MLEKINFKSQELRVGLSILEQKEATRKRHQQAGKAERVRLPHAGVISRKL